MRALMLKRASSIFDCLGYEDDIGADFGPISPPGRCDAYPLWREARREFR